MTKLDQISRRRLLLQGSLGSGSLLVAQQVWAQNPSNSTTSSYESSGARVSLLDFIPRRLHVSIKSGAARVPLNAYIETAFASGERLHAPRGLYPIESTLKTAGVALSGDGIGKTVFRNITPSTGFDLMRCNNGQTDLRGFTLDNGEGNEFLRGSGLVLSNAHECVIRDISCIEQNTQGFAMLNACTRNKLNGLRAYRCRHRGMNISESSNDNIIYDFHAIDCFKAGFLIGFGSKRNLISKLRLFGSLGGCFWLHHGCEQNIVSDVIAGATALEGPPTRPLFRVEIACRDNQFTNITLTGARQRALQVTNGPIANKKVAQANGFDNSPCERNTFKGIKIFGDTLEDPKSVGILIRNSAHNFGVLDNSFEDIFVSGFKTGVSYDNTRVMGSRFKDIRFGNISGKRWNIPFTASLGTRFDNAEALSFAGSLMQADTEYQRPQPKFEPNIDVTNPFGVSVMIVVSGAVKGIPHINGTPVGIPAPNDGNGAWIIGPGQKFRIDGGGPKTSWHWWALN